MTRLPRRALARALVAALATLAACRAERPAPPAGTPWMRPAEQGASSAIYFTLRNPGADTLVLVGVEVDVAGNAMLHRSMDHDGMASMMHVDSVVIPPHDSAVLAERGLHVMATGLRAALVVGDTVVVRLLLHPAPRVDTLRVVVRE